MEHHFDNRGHLADIVDIFSYLGEDHNSSLFVSPILDRKHLLDKAGQIWQHDFLSDRSDQSVYALDTELDGIVVRILGLLVEPLWRFFPISRNFLVNIDLLLKNKQNYHIVENDL